MSDIQRQSRTTDMNKKLLIVFALVFAGCGGPTISSEYADAALDYFDEQRFSKALDYCNKSIELDPRNAEGYNMRAMTYGALGQFDKALVDINLAIHLAPQEAAFYINRSSIYEQLGDALKAKEDFDKAGELLGN